MSDVSLSLEELRERLTGVNDPCENDEALYVAAKRLYDDKVPGIAVAFDGQGAYIAVIDCKALGGWLEKKYAIQIRGVASGGRVFVFVGQARFGFGGVAGNFGGWVGDRTTTGAVNFKERLAPEDYAIATATSLLLTAQR